MMFVEADLIVEQVFCNYTKTYKRLRELSFALIKGPSACLDEKTNYCKMHF